MRQKLSLVLLTVLGLGILSVVYAGSIQDLKAERAAKELGTAVQTAAKANPLESLMQSIKTDGVTAPEHKLLMIEERIQQDPTVLENPRVASAIRTIQTQLLVEQVNARVELTGPERLELLNREMGRYRALAPESKEGGAR